MPNAFGFDDDEFEEGAAAPSTDPGAGPFANVPAETPEVEDEDLGESPLAPEASTPEPAAPAAIDPPAAPTGAAAAAAAADEGEDPAGDAQPAASPTDAEQLLAGRFRTAADLEQGYQHIRELQNRTAERERAHRERSEQLEAALSQAVAMIDQLRAQPQAQPQQPLQPQPMDPRLVEYARAQGIEPEALQLVQQLAAQQAQAAAGQVRQELTAAQRQQLAAQQASAQQQASALAAQRAEADLVSFREAHPDAAPGSDVSQLVGATLEDLDLEFDRAGLELAYECVANPALHRVLRENPNLIDSAQGLDLARRFATSPEGAGAVGAGTQPATPTSAAGASPRPVHVERGGSGLRPESADTEEWAVLKLAKDERKHSSPLGI